MTGLLNIHARPGTMDANILDEMRRDVYHVADYLRDGDSVLDVGAYVGGFALYVKHICPNARILCLEPMSSNFGALKKNVEGVNGIILEQVALAGNPGDVVIYDFGPEASACHSIYNVGRNDAIGVQVRADTLPRLMQKHRIDRLRFLKLDCQGAEFEVIPATPPEVLSRIDYIALEVHRCIAKTGEILGFIPDYERKASCLYRHLLRTHVPIHGDVDADSIQVWVNRELAQRGAVLVFHLRRFFKRMFRLGWRYFSGAVRRARWILRRP